MLAAAAWLALGSKAFIDHNRNGRIDPYEDSSLPIERRLDDLLRRMTIDEMTCQLATLYGYGAVLRDALPTPQWKNEIWKDGIGNIDEHLNGHFTKELAPGMRNPAEHVEFLNKVQRWFIEQTRLGIPVDFTNEGIKGIVFPGATSFPTQSTLGCSWDRELIRQVGIVTGRETKAVGFSNVYSPILDVCRDQRWGRCEESYGEDPFLVAELGTEQVLGIQSQGVASTMKHYAIYSASKGAREGLARTDPQMPWREAEDLHLQPYRTVIRRAHPMGVMASYNDFDGEPVAGSKFFLIDKLRQEFGFDGYVVSDSDAVEYQHSKHRVSSGVVDSAALCVKAGLNVRTTFTPPQDYILPVREALKKGLISAKDVENRAREVLRVKYRLGLFDEPYRDPESAGKIVSSAESLELALRGCRESIVLLKNESGLLPLSKSLKRILVVGPLADAPVLGRYGPRDVETTSVLQGIRNLPGLRAQIVFEKGCEVTDAGWPESEVLPTPMTPAEQKSLIEATEAAKQSDVVIAVLGEDTRLSGESRSRTSLDLTGRQLDILKSVSAAGKPVVLVLVTGQPLTINWAAKFVPAIMSAGFGGAQGGRAVAEAIFGDFNPSGKTNATWVKSVGQIPTCFPYKPNSQSDQSESARVKGVLWPFGFGLSYSLFAYSDLKVVGSPIKMPNALKVEFSLRNSSSRRGAEVVQLYVSDREASLTPWDSVLRGFQRVELEPGQSKRVEFTLRADDLAMIDKNGWKIVEPGLFEVRIGASSTDIKLKSEFQVIGKTYRVEPVRDPYTRR